MTMNDRDPLFERIRAELDRQAEGLDGATRSRLTQARHAAPDAAEEPRLAGWLKRGAPAVALGATLAVLVAVAPWRAAPPPAPVPVDPAVTVAEDLEMLATDEDLELLADLEFYLWLETALPETDAG